MKTSVVVKRGKTRLRHRRKGATVVEFAVIGAVVLFLLIGLAVLTMGVYRYQQVAYLARAGARYASVHGAQYRADHRLPPGTPDVWEQDIRDSAVLPRCTAMAPSDLMVSASWSAGDNRANAADGDTEFTSTIDNTVTVTVTYQWIPEVFLTGPITLTSSATMPVSY